VRQGGALIAEGDGVDGTGTIHTITTLDTLSRNALHLPARRSIAITIAGRHRRAIDIGARGGSGR
jgi:hypothetical protein